MSSLKWREGTLWVEMICKCKSSYFLLDSHEGTSASWCLDNARYINWFNFFMICNISPKLYFSDMCVSVFYTFLYICIKLLSKAVDFVLPSGLLFTLINFLFVCFIWVIRAQARSWWDHWRGCCCSERFPLEWALGEMGECWQSPAAPRSLSTVCTTRTGSCSRSCVATDVHPGRRGLTSRRHQILFQMCPKRAGREEEAWQRSSHTFSSSIP